MASIPRLGGSFSLANPPPEHIQWIPDAFTVGSGVFWTITYYLMIVQGFKDKSYGMPILALCMNMAWELLYGIVFPPAFVEKLVFVSWAVMDCFLIYVTMKYGHEEWKHSPVVAKNLGVIFVGGFSLCLWGHWAFADTFQTYTDIGFWSAWICQNIVSWSCLAQLIARGNSRGVSWAIWWVRQIGTVSANCVFHYRAYFWPEMYGFAWSPAGLWLLWCHQIADCAYPVVLWYVKKNEKQWAIEAEARAVAAAGGKQPNGRKKD